MENASPIKSFLRKHSPIKSRNKPLPAAPRSRDGSPTRSPLKRSDGNARPTSSQGPDKPKKRLTALFRSGEKASDVPHSGHAAHHHYSRSVPVVRSPQKMSDEQRHEQQTASPPSLRRLSQKVSSLEEQLREAQHQLNAYAKHPQASEIRVRNRNFSSRDRVSSAQGYYDDVGGRSKLGRERSSGHLDGVVENLLQGPRATPTPNYSRPSQRRPNPASGRSMTRRASADVELAYERFLQRQEEDEAAQHRFQQEADEHDGFYLRGEQPGGEDPLKDEDSPGRQKRKRSELRESSWKAIQEYQSTAKLSPSKGSHSGSAKGRVYKEPRRGVSETEERPAQRAKHGHDKALPPSPKTGSPSPSRHRRSASQTENKLPEQGKSAVPCTIDATGGPPSPSRRYATSPTKLLTVQEEFEWDDEVF